MVQVRVQHNTMSTRTVCTGFDGAEISVRLHTGTRKDTFGNLRVVDLLFARYCYCTVQLRNFSFVVLPRIVVERHEPT